MLLRQAAALARAAPCSRALSSTAIARKDLVQDLYLKELRAYKPLPVAKDAHIGSVKAYTLPPTPKPPTLPEDLATQLSTYENSEPVKADVVKAAVEISDNGAGAEDFLELIERDLPKPSAHH